MTKYNTRVALVNRFRRNVMKGAQCSNLHSPTNFQGDRQCMFNSALKLISQDVSCVKCTGVLLVIQHHKISTKADFLSSPITKNSMELYSDSLMEENY